jgi:sarcosine oxidase subunit alpha
MIGLGLLRSGGDRIGERVRAVNPVQSAETLVEVVSPHFIDPEGERLRV